MAEIELLGLLDRFGAINWAEHAHYSLPSGVHADVYVRVADGLRSDLAIRRVADWIAPHLTADSVLLADSWTLVALNAELARRFALSPETGGAVLPVLAFEEYPNERSTRALLDSVSGLLVARQSLSVLALISVVSSGALVSNLDALLAEKLGSARRKILSMVDLLPSDSALESISRLRGFSHYAHQRGVHCKLCAQPDKREIVFIDPSKYSPRVETRTEEVMLNHVEAGRLRHFWEAADHSDAVRVHRFDPDMQRHLSVSIDVCRLLGDPGFRQTTVGVLTKKFPEADVVLIPRNSSTSVLRALAEEAYPQSTVRDFDRKLTDNDALRVAFEGVARAKCVLVLDDSVVTGATIRRTHRALQEAAPQLLLDGVLQDNYLIAAFIVVARPAHQSVWDGLSDSLRQDRGSAIETAHLVILPNDPCPWCEELRVLDDLHSWYSTRGDQEATRLLAYRRLHLLGGSSADASGGLAQGLFWSDQSGRFIYSHRAHITPHSLFGERLGEAAAFAAVTSAMQRLRDDYGRARRADRGSAWCWDVRRIVAAYHDPILQCSFLRSAIGSELFVPSSRGVTSAIATALNANDGQSLAEACSLAAEHGLAAIMGKYSQERRVAILTLAEESMSHHPCDARAILSRLRRREGHLVQEQPEAQMSSRFSP